MQGWITDHFKFLTFVHSGAQPWAPGSPKVKNYKSINQSIIYFATKISDSKSK